MASSLLGFKATIVMRLLVAKATTEPDRRGWELGKLQCHQGHFSYQASVIFIEKQSLDGWKPLVNVRSSEKVDLTI